MQRLVIHKTVILGDDNPVLCVGHPADLIIGCTVGAREIKRMGRVMTGVSQPDRKALGELRVNQEPHAASMPARLICVMRAAKASAAKISSRSRSS